MLKRITLSFVALCCLSFVASAQTPVKYAVDAAHSNVGFTIPILNGVSKVRGKFNDFTVAVDYDDADVTKSSVTATIKTASVDTGIEARDKHLRTPDFFDAEKYPEITFQSTKIIKKEKGFEAVGNFTLHGVTKEITIPFTENGSFVNEANKTTLRGFTGTITLNRRDFGMLYKHATIPNWIGDEVQVDLTILMRTQPPKQ